MTNIRYAVGVDDSLFPVAQMLTVHGATFAHTADKTNHKALLQQNLKMALSSYNFQIQFVL